MFSEPELIPQPDHGLRTAFVTIDVLKADAVPFNDAAIAVLNDVIGEPAAPEFDNPSNVTEPGRAGMLLAWIYALCRQETWPIFERGVFQSAGGSDLDGAFHLPTRLSSPFQPSALLQGLLEKGLLLSSEAFTEGALINEVQRHRTALQQTASSPLHRRVIRTLMERGLRVFEVTEEVHRVAKDDGNVFFADGLGKGAGFLLNDVLSDRSATNRLLATHGVPVVLQRKVLNPKGISSLAQSVGYPIMIKPIATRRRAIMPIEIVNDNQLKSLVQREPSAVQNAVIERALQGESLNIVVMGDEVLWCLRRSDIVLSGDGQSDIQTLLERYCAQEFVRPDSFKAAVDLPEFMRIHQIPRQMQRRSLAGQSVLRKGATVRLNNHPVLGNGAPVKLVQTDRLGTEINSIVNTVRPLFKGALFGIDVVAEEGEDGYQKVQVLGVHFAPTIPEGPLMDRYVDRFVAAVL